MMVGIGVDGGAFAFAFAADALPAASAASTLAFSFLCSGVFGFPCLLPGTINPTSVSPPLKSMPLPGKTPFSGLLPGADRPPGSLIFASPPTDCTALGLFAAAS
jgi:hypothetical protein